MAGIMQIRSLLSRNLTYYWRTNMAVVAGVATAVAVLSGALLVGDSVRGSLRDLFTSRIGKTDHIITATGFFRERLATDIQSSEGFKEVFNDACPLIVLEGFVTHEKSRRRASHVSVYGVDERFWQFHNRKQVEAPGDRDALVSPDLQKELGSEPGDGLLLRIEKPTAIPAESLHGRKEELGRSIRLSVREALRPDALGEFSIRPQQGAVRTIFVSIRRLQKDLEQPGKANAILLSENEQAANRQGDDKSAALKTIESILNDRFTLEDLSIRLRPLDGARGVSLENESAIITDSLFESAQKAAQKTGLKVSPVLSYLANSIRGGSGDIPYSLVTAVSPESFEKLAALSANKSGANANADSELPPVILNEWAASDLSVRPGDEITLEYYVWKDDGRLVTESARFKLSGVVPISGAAADRDLVPDYPGITQSESMTDWDPPFDVDLQRVRPKDEDYWHKYRTTPKAFILIDAGQRLWQSRYGRLTSVRVYSADGSEPQTYLETFRNNLRAELNPADSGLTVFAVRGEGLKAASGATDFGEYFIYFSFFIVAAALLLVSLFFKLGIEQRLREIGLLRAVGFPAARVRSLFLIEGVALAAAGSLLGVIGAVAYGALMMYGLRTWWVGAVGTTSLKLHVSALSLILGTAGGIIAAIGCIMLTLRMLRRASLRSLLSGDREAVARTGAAMRREELSSGTRAVNRLSPRLSSFSLAAIFSSLGLLFLIAALSGRIGQTAGFFGAGTSLLVAALAGERRWLDKRMRSPIYGSGVWPVARLGFRSASYRPGRSILSIALIASAAFIIIAVNAFRRDTQNTAFDKQSGTGGYPIMAESVLPLYHDPNTEEGRDELTLSPQKDFNPARVSFARFRVRPGDDASCLNLYQPRNPRIVGATDDFIRSGRFQFQDSLAQSPEQKQNPWLLLLDKQSDGTIPIIADANSIQYVLHRRIGEEIIIGRDSGEAVRLKLVAALADSIFQSELLMSEENFKDLFPGRGGYSFFLLDVAPSEINTAAGALEEQLKDFGFDVTSTSERLAGFHRVENTYLSTFQALGGLGLALGTLGLATVLLRNVLERRRELALLRAFGYKSNHFALMVITENAFLVFAGLVTGVVSALVAIAPALSARGGHLSLLTLGLLLLVVLAVGLLSSVAATIAALRSPLIPALRAE